MTYGEIAALAVIVGVFSTFGAVLAWASWYSQSGDRARYKHGEYPAGAGLLTDDD